MKYIIATSIAISDARYPVGCWIPNKILINTSDLVLYIAT